MTAYVQTAMADTRARLGRLAPSLRARAYSRSSAIGALDPEDLAQSMALQVLMGAHVVHDGAALDFAWRRALDSVRSEVRRQANVALQLDAVSDEVHLVEADRQQTERLDEALDHRAWLAALRATLPDWGGQMLDLLAQGYRIDEIAQLTGITLNNARQRLHRIKAAAKRLSAQRGD